MIKFSRKPHNRTSKKIEYGTKAAYCHADRAASSIGKWATTDHTGLSQSLSNMPKMGLMDISGHKTLACLARYSHMKVERLAAKLA